MVWLFHSLHLEFCLYFRLWLCISELRPPPPLLAFLLSLSVLIFSVDSSRFPGPPDHSPIYKHVSLLTFATITQRAAEWDMRIGIIGHLVAQAVRHDRREV